MSNESNEDIRDISSSEENEGSGSGANPDETQDGSEQLDPLN